MPEIFENIEDLYWHEEIKSCKDGYNGGLKSSEIYYCPAMHVNKFAIPNLLSSFTNAGTISENITPKNRRSFYKLSALVDQNELEASTSFDSSKSSLNLFIVGLEANRVGISRILPSMPGIYIIVDNNGRKWVIGTIISPAFATCSLKSAKKIEDDSGLQINLKSNSIFFQYKGEIPPYRESDFTDEFTDESY